MTGACQTADPVDLRGKVAIVTGASRGIGRQIALELARRGVSVALAARTVTPAGRLGGTIGETLAAIEQAGGTALAVQTDVTRPDDLERLVGETVARFGRLDILVNNAADTNAGSDPVEAYPRAAWLRHFDTNVHGPFTLIGLAVAQMKQHGQGGVIVNMISSAGDLVAPAQQPAEAVRQLGSMIGYAASKAALARLTNALAGELALHGIAILGVDPGFTRTELVDRLAQGGLVDAADAHAMDVPVAKVMEILTAADPLALSGRLVRVTDG